MKPTILVPIDLHDDEPRELTFAVTLARALSADLLLLHVVDYVPTMFPVELPGAYPIPQTDIVREAAEKKLLALGGRVKGAVVRTAVEIGAAPSQIVACARREKVAHIVIGSHSRGAIARMVLGSVADRVAHTAPCPVTIVREPEHGATTS